MNLNKILAMVALMFWLTVESLGIWYFGRGFLTWPGWFQALFLLTVCYVTALATGLYCLYVDHVPEPSWRVRVLPSFAIFWVAFAFFVSTQTDASMKVVGTLMSLALATLASGYMFAVNVGMLIGLALTCLLHILNKRWHVPYLGWK